MIELTLRFVDLRLRLLVLRMLRGLDIGIAAELRQLRRRLLTQRLELALVVEQRVLRLIVYRLRDGAGMQQHVAAIEIGLVEIDLRLLGGDIAQHVLVVLLHGVDRERGLRQIGLGIVERDLKLTRIDPVEDLSRR